MANQKDETYKSSILTSGTSVQIYEPTQAFGEKVSEIVAKYGPKPLINEGEPVKIFRLNFPDKRPTYLDVVEAMRLSNIKFSQDGSNLQGELLIRVMITFPKDRTSIETEIFEDKLAEKKEFDYTKLRGFLSYEKDPVENQASFKMLIRKYESSLLLLKLAIKEEKAQPPLLYEENINQVLTTRAGILTLENKVDPETIVDHIIKTLKKGAENRSTSGITAFLDRTPSDFFQNFIKLYSIDNLTKQSLTKFEDSLKTTVRISPFKPRNPAIKTIENIMNTDNYKKLIERIAIINDRKSENSSTYKTDLLKMQGIVAIENAFEKALYASNNTEAFNIIRTAIKDNTPHVSAYSGGLSEDFFSFFHRDSRDAKHFFTHGYKSTSDEVLEALSNEVENSSKAPGIPHAGSPGTPSN